MKKIHMICYLFILFKNSRSMAHFSEKEYSWSKNPKLLTKIGENAQSSYTKLILLFTLSFRADNEISLFITSRTVQMSFPTAGLEGLPSMRRISAYLERLSCLSSAYQSPLWFHFSSNKSDFSDKTKRCQLNMFAWEERRVLSAAYKCFDQLIC